MYYVSIFFSPKSRQKYEQMRGLLNREDRKDILYFITSSTEKKLGNLTHVRKKVQSRDGLVGYTYVEGDKKNARDGLVGVEWFSTIKGTFFVTLSGGLLRFKPDCPIL